MATSRQIVLSFVFIAFQLLFSAHGGTITIGADNGTPRLTIPTTIGSTRTVTSSTDGYVLPADIMSALSGHNVRIQSDTGAIVFAAAMTGSNVRKLTLHADTTITFSADLTYPGELMATANTHITVAAHLTVTKSETSGSMIQMIADLSNSGSGNFVLTSAGLLKADPASAITVKSTTIQIDGTITTGSCGNPSVLCGKITLMQSGSTNPIKVGDGTFPAGASSSTYAIDNNELDKLTAEQVNVVSGENNGDAIIYVAGVTAAKTTSSKITKLSLLAEVAGKSVIFEGAGSVFGCSIVVSTAAGVTVKNNVEVLGAIEKGGNQVAIDIGYKQAAGNGLFTVNAEFKSTNAGMTIQMGELDIQSSGGLWAAAPSPPDKRPITLQVAQAKDIAVGNNVGGSLNIDGSELQRITCGHLVIGGYLNGNIVVDTVTQAHTQYITGKAEILANAQTSNTIRFKGTSVVFTQLEIRADNGLTVDPGTTLQTVGCPAPSPSHCTGDMLLYGDANCAAGGADGIHIGAAAKVKAAGVLVLESHNGYVDLPPSPANTPGLIIFEADSHLYLQARMQYTGGTVTIQADKDGTSGGEFCITRALSNTNVPTTIKADNFIVKSSGQLSCRKDAFGDATTTGSEICASTPYTCNGGLNTGSGLLTVETSSGSGGTISLVNSDSDSGTGMLLSGPEIQRFTSTGGLILGGTNTVAINVATLSSSAATNIGGITTLMATHSSSGGAGISFAAGYSSPFTSLHVQATKQISLPTLLSTSVGGLSLYSSTDKLVSTSPVTLFAQNAALTLQAGTGIEVRSAPMILLCFYLSLLVRLTLAVSDVVRFRTY